MIDRIELYIADVEFESIEPKIELFLDGVDKYGADKYKGEIIGKKGKTLNVKYVGTRLMIKGSVHKYAKGNNYCIFTYSEFTDVLKELSKKTGIPLEKFIVTNIEFGVNMQMSKEPKEYVDIIKEYKGHKFIYLTPLARTSKIRGCRCKLSEYDIKFYDKTFDAVHEDSIKVKDRPSVPINIFRYELKLSRKHLKSIGLTNVTGKNLLSPLHFYKLKKTLKTVFDGIIFNDISIDYSKILHDDVKRYIFVMSENYSIYLDYLKKTLGEKEFRKEIRNKNSFLKRIAPKTKGELEKELKSKFSDALSKIFTPK